MRPDRFCAAAFAGLLAAGCYYYRVDVPDSAAAPANFIVSGECKDLHIVFNHRCISA